MIQRLMKQKGCCQEMITLTSHEQQLFLLIQYSAEFQKQLRFFIGHCPKAGDKLLLLLRQHGDFPFIEELGE